MYREGIVVLLKRCTVHVYVKVVRGGGAVGAVELSWLVLNATTANDTQLPVMGRRRQQELVMGRGHEFVPGVGSASFRALQTSANLTVSFVNDLIPSLDASYRLVLTNVSQVIPVPSQYLNMVGTL